MSHPIPGFDYTEDTVPEFIPETEFEPYEQPEIKPLEAGWQEPAPAPVIPDEFALWGTRERDAARLDRSYEKSLETPY